MIGRLHHLVLDAGDPLAAATFWSSLLGKPITFVAEDFVVVADNDTSSGLAFQLVTDHQPPTWPEAGIPEQAHWDVMVDDLLVATDQVLALGARQLADTVFADPAGHPFSLIPRPGWASPVTP